MYGKFEEFSLKHGGFPKMVVSQNGRFIMEKLIKMDDPGVPPF